MIGEVRRELVDRGKAEEIREGEEVRWDVAKIIIQALEKCTEGNRAQCTAI